MADIRRTPRPQLARIDPIRAEIIARALDRIAEEMAITMYRTARSPIVNETRDFATAVCDGTGRLVGQSLGAPFLMVTSREAVRAILRGFDDLKPGDVLLNNDSYAGGSHLGDLTVAAPDLPRGPAGPGAVDTGASDRCRWWGCRAGGFYSRAVEIWEESTRIPPMRLVDGGRVREDVYEWLIGNSRFPDQFHGDLQAMMATCVVAERRFRGLLERWGWDRSMPRWTSRSIIASAWRACTSGLARRCVRLGCPDRRGWFRPRSTCGCTSRSGSRGDEVVVDFTGSDPQGPGALNSPLANTLVVDHGGRSPRCSTRSLPKNEGIFRPVTTGRARARS